MTKIIVKGDSIYTRQNRFENQGCQTDLAKIDMQKNL